MPRLVIYLIVASVAFVIGISFAVSFYNQSEQVEKHQSELKLESNSHSKPDIESKGDIEIRFVCSDEAIKPIWNDLLEDKEFLNELFSPKQSKTYDCSEMLKVEQFQISERGRTGYAVFVRWGCGAKGNCPFYIYENLFGKYQRVLKDKAVLSYEVKNAASTGYGYFDIVTEFNGSPYDNYLEHYEFTGETKYERKKCFNSHLNEENGKVKITPVKCWNKG